MARRRAASTTGGAQPPQPPAPCLTPHDVDAHRVKSNAALSLTPSSTHQPRVWLKDEAYQNIASISVTQSTAHPPTSWLNDEAP